MCTLARAEGRIAYRGVADTEVQQFTAKHLRERQRISARNFDLNQNSCSSQSDALSSRLDRKIMSPA